MNTDQYYESHERYNAFREIIERWHINYDLLRFVAGDFIGSGEYRYCFDWNLKPGCVLKVSHMVESNFSEKIVWDNVKDTPFSKWFAPVLDISPCGHFLLMKKARKITDKDKFPKNIPDMLIDIKKSNFGFIGNQLVCFDYQFLSRTIDLALHSGTRKLEFDK